VAENRLDLGHLAVLAGSRPSRPFSHPGQMVEIRPFWPDSSQFGRNLAQYRQNSETVARCRWIPAEISRLRHRPNSNQCRNLTMVDCLNVKVDYVCRLGKMIYALKNINDFSKFTKHFLSNKNHFSIGYYFCPHQTPENIKIIFQKLFYSETNITLLIGKKSFCNSNTL
jgi:hypothetical protein